MKKNKEKDIVESVLFIVGTFLIGVSFYTNNVPFCLIGMSFVYLAYKFFEEKE